MKDAKYDVTLYRGKQRVMVWLGSFVERAQAEEMAKKSNELVQRLQPGTDSRYVVEEVTA